MKLKDGVKILYGSTTEAYKGSPLTLQRGDGGLAVFDYNTAVTDSTPSFVWGGSEANTYKRYNPALFAVDKAIKDGSGNNIVNTYATKASLSDYLPLTGGNIVGDIYQTGVYNLVGSETIAGNLIVNGDTTKITSSNTSIKSNTWGIAENGNVTIKELSATTGNFTGPIEFRNHTTSTTVTVGDSVNPRISFYDSDNSLYGSLVFTDYDAYAPGASLTWLTNQGSSYLISLYIKATGSFVGNLSNTLTFAAGKFAAGSYNNSVKKTIYIPTHTSHLTNDSGFITNSANVASATKLANKRKIWGQDFDGTADITGKLVSSGDIEGRKFVGLTKTYTGVKATTTNTDDGSHLYFGTVTPDSFTQTWHVKYKILTSVDTSVTNYHLWTGTFVVDFYGCGPYIQTYACWNSHRDTGYRTLYHHCVYRVKQAGFNAKLPHLIGVRLRDSKDPTGTGRNFKIQLLEEDNCTFAFRDKVDIRTNITNANDTYYEGLLNFDGCNNGLRESGDDNDTTTMQNIYTRLTAGDSGIMLNSIVMLDSKGTWSSFTTSNGTGTAKPKNTTGFRLGRMFYCNTSNVGKGARLGNSVTRSFQALIDIRYSINSNNTLKWYQPLYIVGKMNNGLFYLNETWWTLTEPATDDGNVYIFVGIIYPDGSADGQGYRLDFMGWQGAYWFKNGSFLEYIYLALNSVNSDKLDGLHASDFARSITLTNEDLNNVTTVGFYNAGDANKVNNNPFDEGNAFALTVIHAASGSYYRQIAYKASGKERYERFSNNGKWSEWKKGALFEDIPTTLPASDVSDWAKASTKPSYSWKEITGKPSIPNPTNYYWANIKVSSSSSTTTTPTFGSGTTIKGALPSLYITDTTKQGTSGTEEYAILRFGHASNNNAAKIFLNGPDRTGDGGKNMMTIRNDVGDLRLDDNVLVTGNEAIDGKITLASHVDLVYDSTNKCLNFNFV